VALEQVTVEEHGLVFGDLAGCPECADLPVQFRRGGPAGESGVEGALHEPG